MLAVPDLDLRRDADQLLGRPDAHDLSLADHGDAVGELLGLVEVVGRQHDRLPERAQRADEIPRSAARGRVEPGGRLVEEHELGVPDQRDAEVETPFLPARERLQLRARLVGKSDQLDHLVDVPRPRVVPREHRMHLADREQGG